VVPTIEPRADRQHNERLPVPVRVVMRNDMRRDIQ
jgi:hypothetical protein